MVAPESASQASREMFLADCERAGFEPTIAAQAFTPEAIIALVAAGLGVTTLPQRSHSLPREGSCTVPVQDMKSVVVMAWREDRRTPAASDFMRVVRQIAHPGDASQFQPELWTNGPFSGPSVPARPLAALSHGRLAFFTRTRVHTASAGESVPATPGMEIEVLDITTGTPVATIDIAHDNDVLGIALEGSNLTWVQQPVAHVLGPPTTNPSLPTCSFGTSPTGPAVVEHENLIRLGSVPITVGTSPAPVACAEGPAPP